MTSTELLEIQPRELKFTFVVKKQSSCLIQLGNKSDQYVAFKVKTTTPRKYCVQPDVGVVKPKAVCDFTVTMQAQKTAPPDLLCKDKFLIQSTVVPFGTSEDEITSDMFSKESGKYVEEKKLKVLLVSPPHLPVLLPNSGDLKKDPLYDASLHKDVTLNGIENRPPPLKLAEDVLGSETAKDVDELGVKAVRHTESGASDYIKELKSAKDKLELNLVKDFEELKSKLEAMDSKLRESDQTIVQLTEDRNLNYRENEMLKHEVNLLRRKNSLRRPPVGFPLLYVCMVALISLALGYLVHP